MAGVDVARKIAESLLAGSSKRIAHVRGVAEAAKRVTRTGSVGSDVVVAAWLHDVGYAKSVARTGLHPLDGARYVAELGFSPSVVGLVAFHTGARFEAAQRGLLDELLELPEPAGNMLDALTLADLSVGPSGDRVTPALRIEEILTRYSPDHPVHEAVLQARVSLIESAERAARATGSPQEWGFAVV
jgi:hypothetical protein